MQKRKILSGVFIILLLAPVVTNAYFIVIEPLKEKLGAVYFDHTRHLDKDTGVGLACDKCHHELKTPEQKPQTCIKCHPVIKPDKTEKGAPRYLKDAYHDKCRGCHKQMQRDYPAAPNTAKCGACHKKDIEKFIDERAKKIQEKAKGK